MLKMRPYLLGGLLGFIAACLVFGVWILWQDHRTLQVLVQIENQREAQQRPAFGQK